MAQPWFEVRHLERKAGLIALSANFELYGDMSSRMMTLAAEYAPRQEIYSIDECFLDFEGVPGDLVAIGRELRRKVLQWTGLPTSIGIASTKTLAKLANHVAKTAERKPGSYSRELAQVCDLSRLSVEELQQVMQATDVGAVWGVGRKTTARLNEGAVYSVLDLIRADIPTLRRQFSVVLEKTLLELRGTPCMDVDDAPAANQQIMCSRSFGEPVTDVATMKEAVSQFASRITEKLRAQGSVARSVQVFFHTSAYRKHDRQHAPSVTMPLSRPTADTRVVIAAALRAVEGVFRPGFNYVKAGVMLVDLQPQGREQGELDLFEQEEEKNPPCSSDRTDLMTAIDALNQRFGRDAVTVASATRPRPRSTHASRQERRTPRYTTRLDEVVMAKA